MKHLLGIFTLLLVFGCSRSHTGAAFESSNHFFQSINESRTVEIIQAFEARQKNLGLGMGHLRDLNLIKPSKGDDYHYSYFKEDWAIIKLDGRYGLLIHNLDWNNLPAINQAAILEKKKEGKWVWYFFYGGVLK
jgi:hypothetical protein